MTPHTTLQWLGTTLTLAVAPTVWAAASAADAAKLQNELTPVGAERAGNKDGTIPAWTGGFSPRQPASGGRRSDPFASEKPLFSIDAQNVDKHASKLTPGVIALIRKYPASFRVDVYPTHRTAALPQRILDATLKAATTTKLDITTDGEVKGLENDTGGIPFPIPANGAEAMMNAEVSYVPPMIETASNYLIQADGTRVLVSTYTNTLVRYYDSEERLKGGQTFSVRSRTVNPPIRAGEQLVGTAYFDSDRDTTWVYLPGQRRVRKLPSACCDTPTPFSGGLISFDEVSVFYGGLKRFNWKLVGKREMYIPYNNNRFMQPTSDDAVFSKFHLNPDHVRWELHRVWVVEASLRPGQRHVMPKSTYYIDEDSWSAVLGERYDAQGQMSRVLYSLPVVLTDVPSVFPPTFGVYDLLAGTAYAGGIPNQASVQTKILDTVPKSQFSPDAMAGDTLR